ncbi:MAG: ABC transporter permease subunit [Myxococcales bacterium]|nr:ABC transporter permease subunit [Myxococcales bacterium]MCB9521049.1 ABC transporter permease subunit [Myxococcales bacterium]MCB9532459.1 ABC transporter permease subunit [Myxococcales bacterium]
MTQYVIKRLLLMVPTFLMITVLLFVMINVVPGRPGGAAEAGGGSQNAQQSANAREGYRLFKEQYYLDKPILLNFRFLLDRQDVEAELETIARNMAIGQLGEQAALEVGRTAAEILTQLTNTEYYALEAQLAAPELTPEAEARLRVEQQNAGFDRVDPIRPPRPAPGRIRDAENRIEDWGDEVVPQLLEVAHDYVHVVPVDAAAPWTDGHGASASALGISPGATTAQIDGVTWRVDSVLTAKVRYLAVQRLTVNARRRVILRDGERGSAEEQATNREIVSENNRLASWSYGLDADAASIAETLALWDAWYADNQGRFTRSAGRNAATCLFETRFARYLTNLFIHQDLGISIRYRRPVWEVIAVHWRYSIFLSVASLLLSYFIAVPLGILAAVRQNQLADRGVGLVLFIFYSLPTFFAASMLTRYLTASSDIEWLQWFPVSGFASLDATEATTWDRLLDIGWHMVLPLACLTYGSLAVLSRYARTGLLDVIRSDYIRTARAKGLSEWVVILKHAVRNGMIPILTLLGTTLPVLIGGSIIIEYIFVIDGIGRLMWTAINFRDYNVIMGVLLLSSVLTLLGILLSDISYALVDPRISFD